MDERFRNVIDAGVMGDARMQRILAGEFGRLGGLVIGGGRRSDGRLLRRAARERQSADGEKGGGPADRLI